MDEENILAVISIRVEEIMRTTTPEAVAIIHRGARAGVDR